jgi:glycosyltransferase involved in cell wall biosynthesis
MRIGIDGACWLNRRGYGRFARELVPRLLAVDGDAEYTLLVDFDAADAVPVPSGIRTVRIPTTRPAARAAAASGSRSLRDLWTAARAISRERFDLVFFPSAYTYVPIVGHSRIVVVIHDVIAEQFSTQVFPTRRGAALWWLKLLAARRQADLVLTVSDASRRAILDRFHLPPQRVAVIGEAADARFGPVPHDGALHRVLARWNLVDGRYLLYVGGMSPHKNLGALIDACAALRQDTRCSDLRLVLVGDFSGDVFYSAYAALQQRVARLQLREAVVFTGYIDDATLAYVYNGAAALVLPSLWEGFGLPVIEAMACGTPVVASQRGALPEVVGAAGLLCDLDRPDDLRAQLLRLLTDPDLQTRLQTLGPQRAAAFSWERSARQTVSAFHTLLVGARRDLPGHSGRRPADTAGLR